MEHLTDLMDEARCVQLLEHWRWPDGVRCPLCASSAIIIHTRRYSGRGTRYLCKDCRRTFNSCTGTIFACSNLPLRAWFLCGYLLNSRLSTLQIAHELGVAYSTAFRLVRALMGTVWLTKLAEKKG
jgi:transposase-like protein